MALLPVVKIQKCDAQWLSSPRVQLLERHRFVPTTPHCIRNPNSRAVAMPTSAFTGTNGLSFRGVPDTLAESHLEGSECCLIHADNPSSRKKGVFLNPNVRVGYNRVAYETVHTPGSWLSLPQIYFGLWKNRISRRVTTPWLKESGVIRRIRKWERKGDGREEPGWFCLINEMQIIVYNGWKHL